MSNVDHAHETSTATPAFLGRCLRCNGRCRVVVASETVVKDTFGRPTARRRYVLPNGEKVTGSAASFRARCWCGYDQAVFDRVKGVYKATVACDESCWHATGCVCTCSCGGANHGASARGVSAA